MISIGLPLYIGAHTVTQGLGSAAMSAATWASPLAYLEAVLTALSEVATVTGVRPDKLRMDTPFGPDPLTWADDATGNLAAGYVGAESLSLAFSADSEPTEYLWTGQHERLPGLQPKYSGWHKASRSGQSGQQGTIAEDTLSIWTSTGDLADLESFYAFAQRWLAGSGSFELRAPNAVTWYLAVTDIAPDGRSSDGKFTTVSVPVVRGV